jgi:hypothetical protein
MCGMLCELEVDSTEYEAVMYTETYLEDDVSCVRSVCMGWDAVEVESQMSHSPKRVPNTRHSLSISRFNRKTLDRRDRRDRRGLEWLLPLPAKSNPGEGKPLPFHPLPLLHQTSTDQLLSYSVHHAAT